MTITMRSMMNCRLCVGILLCVPVVATAGPKPLGPAQATRDEREPILWYSARLLTIEGQGWTDTKDDYDRLPARAENTVRKEVWNLSRQSSGIVVRFVTDAPTIHARWTLTSSSLAMPHMPSTGVSGLDLYVHGKDGRGDGSPAPDPRTRRTA